MLTADDLRNRVARIKLVKKCIILPNEDVVNSDDEWEDVDLDEPIGQTHRDNGSGYQDEELDEFGIPYL